MVQKVYNIRVMKNFYVTFFTVVFLVGIAFLATPNKSEATNFWDYLIYSSSNYYYPDYSMYNYNTGIYYPNYYSYGGYGGYNTSYNYSYGGGYNYSGYNYYPNSYGNYYPNSNYNNSSGYKPGYQTSSTCKSNCGYYR